MMYDSSGNGTDDTGPERAPAQPVAPTPVRVMECWRIADPERGIEAEHFMATQPAAPTPADPACIYAVCKRDGACLYPKGDGCEMIQRPAAPEPSAEDRVKQAAVAVIAESLARLRYEHAELETARRRTTTLLAAAEAQLAAVRKHVDAALAALNRGDGPWCREMLHEALKLTPAPSPGAGERRCGVTVWSLRGTACGHEAGHTGEHGPGAGGDK